jgi:heptaprenyl diphosphate synthase
MKAKKLTALAVSVALSLILSFVESQIPPLVAIPGVKIGLANTVSLFVLYSLGAPSAALVGVVRVSLSSLLFGTPVSFIYSISGAMLSLLVMLLIKKLPFFSVIGVSVAGGVFHNIGQIIAAIIIMKSAAIAVYLPPLLVSGVIAGVAVGIVAGIVLKKLGKYIK